METVTVAKHRRDSNRSVRHRNAKLRKFANPETQERISSETQFLCASLSLILKVGTSDGDRSPQSRNAISNAREKRKFHKGQAQFLVVFHFDSSSSSLPAPLRAPLLLSWTRPFLPPETVSWLFAGNLTQHTRQVHSFVDSQNVINSRSRFVYFLRSNSTRPLSISCAYQAKSEHVQLPSSSSSKARYRRSSFLESTSLDFFCGPRCVGQGTR